MQGKSDRIALEGMQRVIANINMEHMVSRSEMETIFREIGGEAGAIPADRLLNLIWKSSLNKENLHRARAEMPHTNHPQTGSG